MTYDKELFQLFMQLSAKKGSKYAKNVRNSHKEVTIIKQFEDSLDILFTMFWNLIQLKKGSRIGMSVSIDLTRNTSKLFTKRIDKYRDILNEKIIEKIGKYFDIFAPTGLLIPEESLKSDIALNILKEFIHKYNRTLSSFNYISIALKQLTDILKLEGDYKDPLIMKDKKFLEAILKLMIIISKPPKGIYDFFS